MVYAFCSGSAVQLANTTSQEAGHAYGLDLPLPLQYWSFISHLAVGDFGRSIVQHAPVLELVGIEVVVRREGRDGRRDSIGDRRHVGSVARAASHHDRAAVPLALAGGDAVAVGLGAGVRSIFNTGAVNYRVTGDVTVGTPVGNFTIPYSQTGRYSTLGR